MFATAARLAAVTAVAFAVAPATGANATITLENVVVSSAQPAPQGQYKLKDVLVSSAQPSTASHVKVFSGTDSSALLLPAVQKVREAAAR